MKKKNQKLAIFLLLNSTLFFLLALYFYDKTNGDGNGIVKGINLNFLINYFPFATIIYDLYYLISLKKVWIQNLLLSLFMVVLTITLLEWVMGFAIKIREKQEAEKHIEVKGPNYAIEYNKELGYRLPANKTLQYKKTRNNEVIYDVIVKTDSNHLRVTPIDDKFNFQNYAIFFGCSFTFGEGLDSNQTTAYNFYKKNPTFRPYNFGNSAYGPHQMLALLQEHIARNMVKEKNGIAFYTYIPDHINRAIGGTNSFWNTGGNGPYFVEENGKMIRKGLFKDGRFFTKFFYNLMFKSNICRYFNIGYPFKITNKEEEFIATMLSESNKLYKEQFKNDNFYVIFFPDLNKNRNYADGIINYLKQKNVKYLDYTKLFDASLSQYSIKYDGHPSALANKLIIDEVVKDIQIK